MLKTGQKFLGITLSMALTLSLSSGVLTQASPEKAEPVVKMIEDFEGYAGDAAGKVGGIWNDATGAWDVEPVWWAQESCLNASVETANPIGGERSMRIGWNDSLAWSRIRGEMYKRDQPVTLEHRYLAVDIRTKYDYKLTINVCDEYLWENTVYWEATDTVELTGGDQVHTVYMDLTKLGTWNDAKGDFDYISQEEYEALLKTEGVLFRLFVVPEEGWGNIDLAAKGDTGDIVIDNIRTMPELPSTDTPSSTERVFDDFESYVGEDADKVGGVWDDANNCWAVEPNWWCQGAGLELGLETENPISGDRSMKVRFENKDAWCRFNCDLTKFDYTLEHRYLSFKIRSSHDFTVSLGFYDSNVENPAVWEAEGVEIVGGEEAKTVWVDLAKLGQWNDEVQGFDPIISDDELAHLLSNEYTVIRFVMDPWGNASSATQQPLELVIDDFYSTDTPPVTPPVTERVFDDFESYVGEEADKINGVWEGDGWKVYPSWGADNKPYLSMALETANPINGAQSLKVTLDKEGVEWCRFNMKTYNFDYNLEHKYMTFKIRSSGDFKTDIDFYNEELSPLPIWKSESVEIKGGDEVQTVVIDMTKLSQHNESTGETTYISEQELNDLLNCDSAVMRFVLDPWGNAASVFTDGKLELVMDDFYTSNTKPDVDEPEPEPVKPQVGVSKGDGVYVTTDFENLADDAALEELFGIALPKTSGTIALDTDSALNGQNSLRWDYELSQDVASSKITSLIPFVFKGDGLLMTVKSDSDVDLVVTLSDGSRTLTYRLPVKAADEAQVISTDWTDFVDGKGTIGEMDPAKIQMSIALETPEGKDYPYGSLYLDDIGYYVYDEMVQPADPTEPSDPTDPTDPTTPGNPTTGATGAGLGLIVLTAASAAAVFAFRRSRKG